MNRIVRKTHSHGNLKFLNKTQQYESYLIEQTCTYKIIFRNFNDNLRLDFREIIVINDALYIYY